MTSADEQLKKIEERLNVIETKLGIGLVKKEVHRPVYSPPQEPQNDSSGFFSSWLKENYLAAIGIFLVLLAGGWFLSYAFVNHWINESMRVFMGLTIGIASYAGGILLLEKYSKGAQIVITLGAGLCLLSLFAGFQLYHIFPLPYTFAAMMALAAFTAWLAIKKDLQPLASLSIFMAMIIPFLVQTDKPHYIFLINYALLIDIAALAMFVWRKWNSPLYIAWVATYCYSSVFYIIPHTELIALYIAAFYLLFFLPAAILACKNSRGTFLLLTTALAFISWQQNFVPPYLSNILYGAAIALSFSFGYRLSRSTDWPLSKYRLAAIFAFNGMLFLFMMSVPPFPQEDAAFNTTAILLLLEATLAVGLGRFIFQSPKLSAGFALYLIIPLFMLLTRYENILSAPFLSLDFALLCMAIGSCATNAWIFSDAQFTGQFTKQYAQKNLVFNVLATLTIIFLMSLIWNICQIIPMESAARALALLIYIVAGETLIYFSHLKQLENARLAGVGILIFAMSYLLLKEAWEMPIGLRIVTFVIAGALLIGTAFFDKKCKNTTQTRCS